MFLFYVFMLISMEYFSKFKVNAKRITDCINYKKILLIYFVLSRDVQAEGLLFTFLCYSELVYSSWDIWRK